MIGLQELAKSYLLSSRYDVPDEREGFIVADKLGLGGDRDTWLVWVTPSSVNIEDFADFERRLLIECRRLLPQYPNARYSILCPSLEGFSRQFRSEAKALRINLRVPIQFFDAPFRSDDAPEVSSAVSNLRDKYEPEKRVPQPYSILTDGDFKKAQEDDLLTTLFRVFGQKGNTGLHIVLGPAGGGKSILYQSLFCSLYKQFLDHKRRQRISARPIPLIPEYLRQASALRTEHLIESFLRSEVATPVHAATFGWMLRYGFSVWLFDGVDELYAGDRDFFDKMLELLTHPDSQAKILICARHSLLGTCEGFAGFLDEFAPSEDGAVRVYRLDDWERKSKRELARIHFDGRRPGSTDESNDSPTVRGFLKKLDESSSLARLSSVPYYCDLLLTQFAGKTAPEFDDDLELMQHTVDSIIRREIDKGLLYPEQFEQGGIAEWLETIGCRAYEDGFRGLAKEEVEEYALLVLREDLIEDELDNAVQTMTQFPLFIPGVQTGTVTLKHELIGQYLAGGYLARQIGVSVTDAARSMGTHVDFAESLVARRIATELKNCHDILQIVVNALRNEAFENRGFANILDLLLLADPRRDVIKYHRIPLEGRNLSHVLFKDRDLDEMSLRHCNLSHTIFQRCSLVGTKFEGAELSETRFEELNPEALKGAQFGNLEHFLCFYSDRRRIDQRDRAQEWIQEVTGSRPPIQQPCPAALQMRTLLLKYVHQSGEGRRRKLPEAALIRGRRHPRSPEPIDCVEACQRSGFLDLPDNRGYIERTRGDRYQEMVAFVSRWQIGEQMRLLLNRLCEIPKCEHVPKNFGSGD